MDVAVTVVIEDPQLAVFLQDAVVAGAVHLPGGCQQRLIGILVGVFVPFQLPQIVAVAVGNAVPHKIGRLTVSRTAVRNKVGVPVTEVEGPFHRVPVDAFLEPVAAENFFVQGRADHRDRTALGLVGRKHPVHHDVGAGAGGGFVIDAVKQIQLLFVHHGVGVDAERGKQFLSKAERPHGGIGNGDFQGLLVHVGDICGGGGNIQVEHAVIFQQSRPWTKIFANVYGSMCRQIVDVYGLSNTVHIKNCDVRRPLQELIDTANSLDLKESEIMTRCAGKFVEVLADAALKNNTNQTNNAEANILCDFLNANT